MSDYCKHETDVWDGKKSYCEPWERWTNCREVGHCVRDWAAKKELGAKQLSIFDLEEEGDYAGDGE